MSNRLAASTSPYLQQHRDNPVDWYEWGESAFAEAKRRNVPILLSVGYSACHWCHVMAHESFEDEETAAEMNAGFVNIKVDREERPDVDAVYMEAVQATTGRGGWPMTVFLTPDAQPIFAGTYFPAHDHHGMPSFRRVLAAVTEAWSERPDEAVAQGTRLSAAIDRRLPSTDELPTDSQIAGAYRSIADSYDPVNGGIGGAPKFPQQPVLEFLLRIIHHPWADQAAPMLGFTLEKMANGGIYDQVGFGFSRYAVDDVWLVPHFEKMLYDNAQMARLYLWAGIELANESFLRTATETLEYLRRDLRHEDGGFYSAEDADSEGEEGKFYVWSSDEFFEVVGPTDGPAAAAFFGVSTGGNFEGTNILNVAVPADRVAAEHGMSLEETMAAIERARSALFERRKTRIRPGLDHKVLASWNGLAIRAFAEAGAALDRPDLLAEAEAAANFVLGNMRRPDGRLARSWSEGRVGVDGFLEDHASMALGMFSLYMVTGKIDWYRTSCDLVDLIIARFADPDGGFYTTADDAPPLIKRPKDQMDNPLPSGNSMAAEALFLRSLFTGEGEIRNHAEATVRSGGLLIERYPTAAGHLLAVASSMIEGGTELAIVGPDADSLAGVAFKRFRPHLVVASATTAEHVEVVPLLRGRWREDTTLAYVCRGFVCDNPTSEPAKMLELIDGHSSRA